MASLSATQGRAVQWREVTHLHKMTYLDSNPFILIQVTMKFLCFTCRAQHSLPVVLLLRKAAMLALVLADKRDLYWRTSHAEFNFRVPFRCPWLNGRIDFEVGYSNKET